MTEPGAGADRLTLVDWRRRVADLYADVRAGGDHPEAAWRRWRAGRDELLRTHPQSPVPADARPTFVGRYFPYDPALRFDLALRTAADAAPGLASAEGLTGPPGLAGAAGFAPILPMSTGDALHFARLGEVDVPFTGGTRRLSLYWMAGYAGGLFLPFRDATNGDATYGAGRYLLDTAKGADLGGDVLAGRLVLDFNFSYQPSCAFDPQWSCPLAPPDNRLDIPIEAGERIA